MNPLYYQSDLASSSQDSYEAPATPLHVNVESRPATQTPPLLRVIRALGAVVAVLAFVVLVINNGGTVGRLTGFTSNKALEETTDSDFSISVEVTSPGYDEVAASLEQLPWDAIAEPYRTQYISVSEFVVDGETLSVSDDQYDVSWSLAGTTYSGTDVEFQIDATGVYDCTVSITPKSAMRRRLGSSSKKESKKSRKSEKSSEARFSAYHSYKSSRAAAVSSSVPAGAIEHEDATKTGTTTSTSTTTTATTVTSKDDSAKRGSSTGPATLGRPDASDLSSVSSATHTTSQSSVKEDVASPSLDSTEDEEETTTSTSTAARDESSERSSSKSKSSKDKRSGISASVVSPGMATMDTTTGESATTTTTAAAASTTTTTTSTSTAITGALGASLTTTATTTTAAATTSDSAMGSVQAGVSYTLSFTLAVKYVRREIRDMSETDRTNMMNAIYLMYTVDEVPGKAAYGEKFNTAEYFVYKHLNGAGTTDCDHWHDGAGIVTHHMALTLEVEQAIQAVDPSLSMAYWEYGKDPYLYDNWWESPMFDSDMFGEANPSNDDHVISDGGLWDGIAMPGGDDYMTWSIPETGSLNPFVNGYSTMRSPWNNNPSPYIGRHNQTYDMTQYGTMPLCSTLQSCFKSTSLAYVNDCLNGATHGPVHIMIGGAWGQGTLFDDPDIEFAQMPDKLLFFKVLWRMGYTRCPETCTFGEPCKCAVPQEYIDEYGAETLLTNTNIIYALASDLVDADDELYLKTLRAVEDPGIAGEMFSSAASFDPSFWPLHGAMERLLDLKRIYVATGELTNFDETWAFVTYNKASGAAYLDGVCDWSKVAGSGDLTLPTCTLDVICDGHNENDVLEFAGFTGGDSYTNAEFYDFIHPWSDDLPYTYDTFDYDYCDEQVRWGPSPQPLAPLSAALFSPHFFSLVADLSSPTPPLLSSLTGLHFQRRQQLGGARHPARTSGHADGRLRLSPQAVVQPARLCRALEHPRGAGCHWRRHAAAPDAARHHGRHRLARARGRGPQQARLRPRPQPPAGPPPADGRQRHLAFQGLPLLSCRRVARLFQERRQDHHQHHHQQHD